MANVLDDLLDDAKKKGSEIWGNIKKSSRDKLKRGFRT